MLDYLLRAVVLSFIFTLSSAVAPRTEQDSPVDRSLQKRSEGETFDSVDKIQDFTPSTSTSEETSHQNGRRAKYPSLYRLMLDTPVAGKIRYKTQDGVLVAQLDDEILPSDVIEARKRVTSSNNDGIKRDWYSRNKAQAEAEGKLEEFKQRIRERGAKQRAKVKEEEKSGLYRYQHECRKLNVETMRVIDPEEAQRKAMRRKLQNRESSKKYYLKNVDKRRARVQRGKGADGEGNDLGQPENGKDSMERTMREFDLNDPAPFEDEESYPEEETPMLRRGLTKNGNSKLPLASHVKHPDLLPLIQHIKPQTRGKKLVSNSEIYMDPNGSKMHVKLRDVEDLIEIDATPSSSSSSSRYHQDQSGENDYQKRLRKAKEQGPEALEAFRKLRRDSSAAYLRRKAEKGLSSRNTLYYRYQTLARKKELAKLMKLNPALAKERIRLQKQKKNIAQNKYRKKVRDGLPIKKYRRYTDDDDENLNEAFDTLILSGGTSSESGDLGELQWQQRGKRTQRFVVEDPVKIPWGNKGTRKIRDGRNEQWTSEELEAFNEAEEEIDDPSFDVFHEEDNEADYDDLQVDMNGVKYKSLDDSSLHQLEEFDLEEQQSFSQLPFAHLPYDQMTKYQQRLFRAEQKGELEAFREKKKQWQANYVNRAIEKEKKLLANNFNDSSMTRYNGGETSTQEGAETSESPPVTYYGVRRRRMKEKGTYEDFKREKALKQRYDRELQNAEGDADADEDSDALLGLPAFS